MTNRRWWLFAIGAGVLAAVLAALWPDGSPAPQAPPRSAPGTALQDAAATPVVAQPAAPGPPPVAAAVAPPSNLRLMGVIRARSDDTGRASLALIAVDGAAARPYRIGETVVDGLVLQSASRRAALLGPAGGPASLALDVAPPADAPGVTALPRATPAMPTPQPAVTAPAATREAVPVADPADHGADTSNR